MAFTHSSAWFQKGAYSLLNRIGIVFFGFLNVFFMVRMMPKEEIGIWALFLSVTSILELLRNGFIRNPMITHYMSADSDEERSLVLGSSLVLHCILVAFVSILLLIGSVPLSRFWDAPQLDILFYIYIFRGFALIPALHIEYYQQCYSNFKAIFYSNVARMAPLGIYTMAIYFLGMKTTLVELSIVQLLSVIASVFVGYFFSRGTKLFVLKFNKKLILHLSSFGKYTMGTTISSMFIKSTDSWMIGRLTSTVGVALYNPALRISNLVEVPTLAIASLVFPQVNQKMKERGEEGVREVYVKSVSLILAIILPLVIPVYVLSDFVIAIIFGKDYMEAAPILRVTIFYTLIVPFNRQFGTVLDALKKPELNFYLLVVMGVLNVIFNYFLLMRMGPIGAAYGTLLSYIIIFILNQSILYSWYRINTFKVFPAIIDWYRTGWEMLMTRVHKLNAKFF